LRMSVLLSVPGAPSRDSAAQGRVRKRHALAHLKRASTVRPDEEEKCDDSDAPRCLRTAG
jgi:hypothetical protein